MTYDGILSHLKTENIHLSVFDCVTSTNTVLKEMALNGATEGSVVVALSQTAGRGRYNRKFYSEKGGIYLSILLRPKNNGLDTTLLTSASAVAVSDAIEKISNKPTQIKWVNDILILNKKVCGILCEGSFTGENDFIIIGIGINAYQTENGFNDEIKDIANTVFDCPSPALSEKLCAAVIDNVFYEYKNLKKREFINKYRQKNIVIGKKVDILKQGKIIDNGKVLSIDDNCHIIIKLSNGEISTLSSGEVSVKL